MTLNFHVRHEVTPERVAEVLQAIARGETFDYVIQPERQVGRLRTLGLITDTTSKRELTPLARELLRVTHAKPNLLPELMHYLHYSCWSEDAPLERTFLWTYRTFCDWLVEQGECKLTRQWLEATVTHLLGMIRESPHFSHALTATRKGAVSLSTDSLNGILHWLRPLRPPVIEGNTFTRRYFCPPELLLLALGYTARQTGAEIGIDMLLTSERREMICRICLLESNALDRALDWMLPLYPEVVEPGTRTGAYGRFVLLRKMPALSDLVT